MTAEELEAFRNQILRELADLSGSSGMIDMSEIANKTADELEAMRLQLLEQIEALSDSNESDKGEKKKKKSSKSKDDSAPPHKRMRSDGEKHKKSSQHSPKPSTSRREANRSSSSSNRVSRTSPQPGTSAAYLQSPASPEQNAAARSSPKPSTTRAAMENSAETAANLIPESPASPEYIIRQRIFTDHYAATSNEQSLDAPDSIGVSMQNHHNSSGSSGNKSMNRGSDSSNECPFPHRRHAAAPAPEPAPFPGNENVFDDQEMLDNPPRDDDDEDIEQNREAFFEEHELLDDQPIDEKSEAMFYMKTVLENMETDHFENLPDGWNRITHNCGLPIYLHRESRVVTVSRPYFIGPDSVRAHKIPLTSVPCLHQKRLNERKEAEQNRQEDREEELDEFGQKVLKAIPAPAVRVEQMDDYRLTADEVTDYAKTIYKFKQIKVQKYKNFREKKAKKIEQRDAQSLQRAGLSEKELSQEKSTVKSSHGIQFINVPTVDSRFNRQNFVMNPAGKSSLQILHDYVQRALKGRIRYDIDELSSRNATANPYMTTAIIFIKKSIRIQAASTIREKLNILAAKEQVVARNDWTWDPVEEDAIPLGRGQGASKKSAKMLAAEMALKILIPDLRFDGEHKAYLDKDTTANSYDHVAISMFDNLEITDERVPQRCIQTGQSQPMVLLKEAYNRSAKLHIHKIDEDAVPAPDQQTTYTITIGDYKASATAVGSKIARQRAAQKVLQQMHPEFNNYGALLRVYASADEKAMKRDATRNHDEVVRLQNKGPKKEPNHAVIDKLKAEMMKIQILSHQRPPLLTTRPPVNCPYQPILNTNPAN